MDWKIPLFKIYWDEDDIKRVTDTLKSGMNWATGPAFQELEKLIKDYVGTGYAVAFNSGTSALHAILLAYGIGKGDEVIVPSFTFIATANAPLFVGAKPVFADIEPTTYGLDPKDVAAKITKKTKAIIPIHYGGSPCRIAEIKEIARKHKLLLIEDAAESFGSKWNGKFVGTFGDAAVFSMCQNKVFTTGEGGFITTDDKNIYEKLKLIRSHGRAETADFFSTIEYMDYITLGYNFRLSNILAALGVAQVKKVDKTIGMRRENAAYLTNLLSGVKQIEVPQYPAEVFHVYQEFPVRVREGRATRDALQKHLAAKGIMTRISFHPIHLTHFYKKVQGYRDRLPVTDELSAKALTLPAYPTITKEQMDFIGAEIKGFFKGAG